jgi:putative tryptophan/tyrosine transport system ATP-binding protein
MIALKGVKVIYNEGSSLQQNALNNVTVDFREKEFVVIIGSNGSGKSTLLNSIAGSIRINSGTIYIDNKEVTDEAEHERARHISRIFQNPLAGTAPDLSILDNFRLAALRTGTKGLTIGTNRKFIEKVREKISFLKMGLENNIYKPIGSLSGGQRQALTLVMGIMDHCKIMLLDEPVAALDPRSASLVMEKADEIIQANQLTAIMVTHNMKDALKYGNRLLMMREGAVIKDFSGAARQELLLEEMARWFD